MLVRSIARQAAVIAAILVILPGYIGAGEAEDRARPALRLAALTEAARPVAHAALAAKWRALRERMRHEERLIAACRHDPASCDSEAATHFLALVDVAREREGRARIGEINRSVNLSVRPVADAARHGTADIWTSPLVTLAEGQGDCEDYAIAKLALLWAAGFAESETRLAIVRDPRLHADHAIALVRLNGRWLALDNRRFTLIEAAHLHYEPRFVIGGDGIAAFAGRAWDALDAESGAVAARPAEGRDVNATPVQL